MDFLDIEIFNIPLPMFVIGCLCALLIIVFVIIFFIQNHKRVKFHDKVDDLSNTVRIFKVDIKNDKVNYFNSSKLRGRKTSSITSFYNQFDFKDREKLISWIGDLLDDEDDTIKYLEVRTYIKKNKKIISTMLQVTKIDYKKQIIYLESTLLNNIDNVTKASNNARFVAKEIFEKNIKKNPTRGYTFCLNFFDAKTKIDYISLVYFARIKEIVRNFITSNISICLSDSSAFLITDLSITNRIQACELFERIKTQLNRYLMLESLSDEIGFSVGVAENQAFYSDVRSLEKNVNNLSLYARDNNLEIVFYDENKMYLGEESTYKTEIENIIQKGKLKFLYQPIYSSEAHRVNGYLASVSTENSVFKSIDELKNFAIRTDDDKELFSTIAKNMISNYIQENQTTYSKLFMPISFNETQYVNRTFGHINDIYKANIVLVIKENDIVGEVDQEQENTVIDTLRSFKSKGYAVALEIDDNVLTLAPFIYEAADYFIINLENNIDTTKQSNIATFQGLIEKLSRYQKTLISTNIPNWDGVELVYKFGIKNFASNAIATSKDNIVPIDKKVLNKIRKLEE